MSFSQLESIARAKIDYSARKQLKDLYLIPITVGLSEEWHMWVYFLNTNTGAPWRKFSNIYFQADVSSGTSGRSLQEEKTSHKELPS